MRETRTNKRLSSTEAVLELFKKEVQRNEILDFDDFAAFNEDRLAIGLKSDEVEMLLQRLTCSINEDTRTNILHYRRALMALVKKSASKKATLERDELMVKADKLTRASSNPWGEPGLENHYTRDEWYKEKAVDYQLTG